MKVMSQNPKVEVSSQKVNALQMSKYGADDMKPCFHVKSCCYSFSKTVRRNYAVVSVRLLVTYTTCCPSCGTACLTQCTMQFPQIKYHGNNQYLPLDGILFAPCPIMLATNAF